MAKAAAFFFVIGVIASHAEPLGSTLTGAGQFIVGVATLLTVVSTRQLGKRNSHKIDGVKAQAATAAVKAEVAANHSSLAAEKSVEAVASIGPANGATVLQVLHEIQANSEYQHRRNHDILNALTPIGLAVPTMIEAIERNSAISERLLARLDEDADR